MKVINGLHCSFRGKKADLSFVNRIRDVNVDKLEALQKIKIELLVKFRDAKKIVEAYKYTIEDLLKNKFEQQAFAARTDLAQMEHYVDLLRIKLREINLEILAEEEKNY